MSSHKIFVVPNVIFTLEYYKFHAESFLNLTVQMTKLFSALFYFAQLTVFFNLIFYGS